MPAEMVRINTRISKTVNDFLDAKSEESGVPKSTLIYLALEQYMNQQKTIEMMPQLHEMINTMKLLQEGADQSQRSDS